MYTTTVDSAAAAATVARNHEPQKYYHINMVAEVGLTPTSRHGTDLNTENENEIVSSMALPTQASRPLNTAGDSVENDVSGDENNTTTPTTTFLVVHPIWSLQELSPPQISTDSYTYYENNQEVAGTPKSDGCCSRVFQSPNNQPITYETLNISPG